mgnify:CR=1 FL=1
MLTDNEKEVLRGYKKDLERYPYKNTEYLADYVRRQKFWLREIEEIQRSKKLLSKTKSTTDEEIHERKLVSDELEKLLADSKDSLNFIEHRISNEIRHGAGESEEMYIFMTKMFTGRDYIHINESDI